LVILKTGGFFLQMMQTDQAGRLSNSRRVFSISFLAFSGGVGTQVSSKLCFERRQQQ